MSSSALWRGVLVLVVLGSLTLVNCGDCPWEDGRLLKWSDPDTWDSKQVPGTEEEVTIPAKRRVVLDTQPATLANLTIEAEGALVWGDVDGLHLDTHYIWVKGEFLIGSPTCRFTKNARIRLRGHSKDKYHVPDHEFGRKFLGVAPGGTLELHGELKTSWTKLAQTVPPASDIQCSLVYDHNNLTTNTAGVVNAQGLNVIVWNEDGSMMDFNAFKSYELFADFFDSIPDKKVVAMYTHGNEGILSMTEELRKTIVNLGGSVISKLQDKQGYSFIGKKGSSRTVREVAREDNSVMGEEQDFLTFHDTDKGLMFQVAVNPGTVKAFQMFRVVNEDALFTKLTLVDEVKGWKKGDQVVLTSTDYEWTQAETRRIVGCTDCSPRQIRVNAPLTYMHYGNFTRWVDERGEVAMLSRGIVVEGELESTCRERTKEEVANKLCHKFRRDTFGGHLMVVRGFKSAHVRGVKLLHMGQQNARGAYPLHFHMCDNVEGAYLRENTIVDSFSRCVAVHGTDALEVSDNVCYKHLGHGLFLEDSVEQHNRVVRNLIVGTAHGTLLLSDKKKAWCTAKEVAYCDSLASFWLTHPNNEIRGNVAAGGDGIGYMIVFADEPLGPSKQRQKELKREHSPKTFPLNFTGNVAHSYQHTGVHMDEKISTQTGVENKGIVPENGVIRTENQYDPQVNGKPVWTEMSNGTYYKNKMKNLWIKGGNIRVSYSTMADSKESFTGGTTLFDSGTEVYKSIFVGETDNVGDVKKRKVGGVSMAMTRSYAGDPNCSLTAVSLYQGPVFVRSCFFDNYPTKYWCLQDMGSRPVSECSSKMLVTRYAGAISFKRSNTYPTMTSSYVSNNTFGFCDNTTEQHWLFQGPNSAPDWTWKDGNWAVFVRDKDGKLTGTPNASIVPNLPLYSGHECQLRTDWGNMLACPYRYIKLEILGKEGNLYPDMKDKYPLLIRRDDSPFNVPFTKHMGRIRNEFLLRTNRSFVLDFNASLTDASWPSEIRLFGYGVEKGDVVRVGICQPRNASGFDILMFYPVPLKNNATWVTSLAALDADTTGAAFFHDKTNGMLFFKILSFHTDTNETQQCPAGKCWRVVIRPKGDLSESVRTCGGKVNVAPYQGDLGIAEKPTTPSCPGIATPDGQGSVDWSNPGYIEHKEYKVTCKRFTSPVGRTKPEDKGCYALKYDRVSHVLLANEAVIFFKTMTVGFCLDRCYYRKYKYAGLANGFRCTCSNSTGESSFQATSADCNVACRGNAKQICGSSSHVSVWSTGL
ncbi:cell surface hyaluronidase CEMIP2-like [Babylonia areolata]|uniref:cell surface hyaluronidase CEMIP2-like n=1 Tax=Babylonia areolata TaxID=304850 RepID=UPI003FD3E589